MSDISMTNHDLYSIFKYVQGNYKKRNGLSFTKDEQETENPNTM